MAVENTKLAEILLALVSLIVGSVLSALPVMIIWNALMPDLFGLNSLGFMQALGLMILCSLLFKNTGGSK